MTDQPTPPGPPPGICPNCAAHQVHHELDPGRLSYYCPHTGTMATWDSRRGAWRMATGVDQAMHRQLMDLLATGARVMTDLQKLTERPAAGDPT